MCFIQAESKWKAVVYTIYWIPKGTRKILSQILAFKEYPQVMKGLMIKPAGEKFSIDMVYPLLYLDIPMCTTVFVRSNNYPFTVLLYFIYLLFVISSEEDHKNLEISEGSYLH